MNIFNDEIIEIIELDEENTIDIEIDSDSHLFFANGILTHNSGTKSKSPDIEHVAESMGLIATVDSAFVLIPQDEIDMTQDEIELKALALREAKGIGNRQKFHIDYNYMRIIQQQLMSTELDSMFT